MLPNSFYDINISLILKPDKDPTCQIKSQANIPDEHRYKNPQKNMSKLNQQYIKGSYTTIKWNLSQGWNNSTLN